MEKFENFVQNEIFRITQVLYKTKTYLTRKNRSVPASFDLEKFHCITRPKSDNFFGVVIWILESTNLERRNFYSFQWGLNQRPPAYEVVS